MLNANPPNAPLIYLFPTDIISKRRCYIFSIVSKLSFCLPTTLVDITPTSLAFHHLTPNSHHFKALFLYRSFCLPTTLRHFLCLEPLLILSPPGHGLTRILSPYVSQPLSPPCPPCLGIQPSLVCSPSAFSSHSTGPRKPRSDGNLTHPPSTSDLPAIATCPFSVTLLCRPLTFLA